MDNLLWVDLEMTGLDVSKEVIIEVAAIVTDSDFNEIDTYQSVVKQKQIYLDAMDDWNKEHHHKSGLLQQIPDGKDLSVVETELSNFVNQHYSKPAILAGNSIAQDRKFIDKYMASFEGLLHYRMLDVSSWKIVFKDKFKKEYEKKGTHRALDDIRESISEFKFYLSFINVK